MDPEFDWSHFWALEVEHLQKQYERSEEFTIQTNKRHRDENMYVIPIPYYRVGDFYGFDFKLFGLEMVYFVTVARDIPAGYPMEDDIMITYSQPLTEPYVCRWPMKNEGLTYSERQLIQFYNKDWTYQDAFEEIEDLPPLRNITVQWLDIFNDFKTLTEYCAQQWLDLGLWSQQQDLHQFYNWMMDNVCNQRYYESIFLFRAVERLFDLLDIKYWNLLDSYGLSTTEDRRAYEWYQWIQPNSIRSDEVYSLRSVLINLCSDLDSKRREFIDYNIRINISIVEHDIFDALNSRQYLCWSGIASHSSASTTMYYSYEKYNPDCLMDRGVSFTICEYLFADQLCCYDERILCRKEFYDKFYETWGQTYDFYEPPIVPEYLVNALEKLPALDDPFI